MQHFSFLEVINSESNSQQQKHENTFNSVDCCRNNSEYCYIPSNLKTRVAEVILGRSTKLPHLTLFMLAYVCF